VAVAPVDAGASGAADRLIERGQRLEDQGNLDAALACYRDAAAAAPRYVRAHINVGHALERLGRAQAAGRALRRAVECAPDYAPAHFNLGLHLVRRGELRDGEAALRHALRLDAAMKEAAIVLADVLERTGRLDEAEAMLVRALEIAPEHAGAMFNYGTFCLRQGRTTEALEWLQRARALDANVPGTEGLALFVLNLRTDVSARDIADAHLRYGRALEQRAGTPFATWPNERDPQRRLRIGYVSGDFGPHAVAFFMQPLLKWHDRTAFGIHCYSNYPGSHPVTQLVRERADRWREIATLDDAQAADLVRSDGIDILVDLSGHTDRNRLGLFARHPAPVQATWLGYLNTTGLATMDYRICDAHTDPPGETESLHTERLLRMPDSQWCYFAWDDIGFVDVPHAARPDALIFGSFNQYPKITDASLALWARVLRRVPHAELVVFDARQVKSREALAARMAASGIDPSRVTFRGREPLASYFAALATSTSRSMHTRTTARRRRSTRCGWACRWSRCGASAASHAAASAFCSRSARADLLARSADEYVEVNVRLASDAHWRAELRRTLRPRLEASPLMDAGRFTRALEMHYRTIWREWCGRSGAGSRSS
jgi:predicted O-linked N-acetylglucosamine transferase (SPINDLY family)